MKKITDEEVKHIAKLSALTLDDGEIDGMKAHLTKVLGYFETLDSVDVSDVPPTEHILGAVNVLRKDVPKESMPKGELIANAPESDGGAYVVPRVVE